MNIISPFFRSPFTDITGGMISYQMLGKCAYQEMEMMDCLEAYGLDRGLRKCQDLIDDFKECQSNRKQFCRFMAMRKERDKQIAAGKLKGENRYCSPRVDSY